MGNFTLIRKSRSLFNFKGNILSSQGAKVIIKAIKNSLFQERFVGCKSVTVASALHDSVSENHFRKYLLFICYIFEDNIFAFILNKTKLRKKKCRKVTSFVFSYLIAIIVVHKGKNNQRESAVVLQAFINTGEF